jgi:tol-pal system protein YbgF
MARQSGMGMGMPRLWLGVSALAAAVVLPAFASNAQQAPPGARPPQVSTARPAPPAVKDGAPAADAGLQRRVEQLEEQLVDLQVVIGTLESLAKGGAAASPSPAGGMALSASDAGRLDALETQIRALAAQLESLQEEVRGLAGRGGGAGQAPSGFGSVTVAPEGPKDDLDRVFPPAAAATPPARGPASPQSGPATAEAEPQPQQLYERAYGYLLQKDYSTAETSFDDFLKRHPTHPLAGNAQYWLGETYYVRGQYRPAAAAFLKGYQDYVKSQKAPESLLKLAMSLQRLGQKDAACSSYSEFATKFPNPPAHIKSLAQAERQRSGC